MPAVQGARAVCHALKSLDHGFLPSKVVQCVSDFWCHSRRAPAARRVATFLGHGPPRTDKRSSLVARRPGLWLNRRRKNRARAKRATVSVGALVGAGRRDADTSSVDRGAL